MLGQSFASGAKRGEGFVLHGDFKSMFVDHVVTDEFGSEAVSEADLMLEQLVGEGDYLA